MVFPRVPQGPYCVEVKTPDGTTWMSADSSFWSSNGTVFLCMRHFLNLPGTEINTFSIRNVPLVKLCHCCDMWCTFVWNSTKKNCLQWYLPSCTSIWYIISNKRKEQLCEFLCWFYHLAEDLPPPNLRFASNYLQKYLLRCAFSTLDNTGSCSSIASSWKIKLSFCHH